VPHPFAGCPGAAVPVRARSPFPAHGG
jgi:hypothetical protein